MNHSRKIGIVTIIMLVGLVFASVAVAADTTVIANTKDWQSTYLISVYADYIDADFMVLKSLTDAELKTNLLGDEEILIFESTTTPVIKNYRSFLSINGYETIGEYRFFDAYDLQDYFYEEVDPSGIVLLGTDFGMEAIAAVPYLLEKNYFPYFYVEDNFRNLYRISRRGDVVALGRVPYRVVEELRPDEIIIGDPKETTAAITQLAVNEADSEWGVMTRIDEIDYDSVRGGLPVFVYYGDDYVDEIIQTVRGSNIDNFEVIGGNMAEVAQSIEQQSERDLNLLLKFGRKITNLDGLEDDILNVDTVELPFPFEDIELLNIEYHNNLDLITLTYRNDGNIDVYVFSNIDYGGTIVSDERARPLRPGEEKTIAYDVRGLTLAELDEPATITTRYGFTFPLQSVIGGQQGLPFIQRNVTQSTITAQAPNLEFRGASFTEEGQLRFSYVNRDSQPVEFFTEMLFEDTIRSSETKTVEPGDSATVTIDFTYVSDARLIDLPFNVTTHFGGEDTYFTEDFQIVVEQPVNYTALGVGIAAVVLAVIVFGIVRKRRQSAPPRRTTTRKQTSKRTTKRSSKKTTKKSSKRTKKSSRKKSSRRR